MCYNSCLCLADTVKCALSGFTTRPEAAVLRGGLTASLLPNPVLQEGNKALEAPLSPSYSSSSGYVWTQRRLPTAALCASLSSPFLLALPVIFALSPCLLWLACSVTPRGVRGLAADGGGCPLPSALPSGNGVFFVLFHTPVV